MKRLIHGDCLFALQDSSVVPERSIGLVYLDPPYGTERLFSAGLRRKRAALKTAEPLAFGDRWEDYEKQLDLPGDLKSLVCLAESTGGRRLGGYVRFMAERLFALEPRLSPTASIYVHVAPPVAPYLRLVLDSILGAKSFRNEIAWKRTHAHSSSKRFGPVHDSILFYAKDGFTWRWPKTPADPAYFEKHYRNVDSEGRRFQLVTCTGPGDRTGTAAHYEWRGQLPPTGRHWAWKKEEMERLEQMGRIHYSKTGTPRRVYYADEHEGVAVQDVWTDLPRLDSHSRERLGYETQKPSALLDRILSASLPTNGELVFDGFAGTGTTLLVAEKLGASWLGCDVSRKAIALSIGRLGAQGLATEGAELLGGLRSMAEVEKLAHGDGDTFGLWATGLFGLLPDRELHSRGVIFAANEEEARAVAGRRVTRSHVESLAKARSQRRYSLSLLPAPKHPDVRSVALETLVCRGDSQNVPLSLQGAA